MKYEQAFYAGVGLLATMSAGFTLGRIVSDSEWKPIIEKQKDIITKYESMVDKASSALEVCTQMNQKKLESKK